MLRSANPVWVSGRVDTVLRWMEWFAAEGLIQQHPAIAVHGALIYALVGRAGDSERWAAAAERATSGGVLDDGNTLDGTLAYLRALVCRDGPDRMRHDARQALDGLSPTSPYRPAMLHAEGLAHLLEGDPEQADAFFARAFDEALSVGVVPFLPVALAERGLAAIARDDWPQAEAFADQALAAMEDGQFDDYWTSALVYAWAAHVCAHQGEVARAQDLVRRAARLRPLLNHALPVVAVQALLELARAYLAARPTRAAPAPRSARSTTSAATAPISARCPSRRGRCGPGSSCSRARCWAPRR